MDRKRFVDDFKKASDQLDKKRLKKVVKRSVQTEELININYVIVMEELAELSQQVSKSARGMCDKMGLIEEMADVFLCFVKIQNLCDVSTLDLYKAVNVKLNRLEKFLNKQEAHL